MNTAVHQGNQYQAEAETASYSGSAAASVSASRRPRHLKVAGTPIDEAFGKVDILWQLDKRTLEGMACDPTTPIILLERLALHPNADVRAAVADNENAPLYTIWTLAKDADADVRYQLAENHQLPIALIRSLTNDENPYVASRAQQTYDRLRAG